MNLKDFLNNRDKPPELYWSLVMEAGWVQAGIWYILGDTAEIINIGPGAAWEEEADLVNACDAALSSSIAKLPENYAEPSKTVFGVPAKWVKGGEIVDEYLALIKQICTDLSLTPVGFVVLPEAIAHLYKSEEGSPLSGVIVGLGKEELEVSVFKLGNLAGTTSVARSASIIEDVIEGLSRFEGAAPLPSRIVIYSGKGAELEDAKEELMKATWDDQGKVKFLHTPNAEVVISDRKVLATSLAGAAEIGDVSQVNLIPDQPDQIEEIEELPPKEEIENIAEPEEMVTAEDLGFVVDQPVDAKIVTEHVEPKSQLTVNVPSGEKVNPHGHKFGVGVKKLFHGFSPKTRLFSKVKFTSPKFLPQGKVPGYLVILFLVLLVTSIGSVIWFIPRATVTIFVSPKTFQEQVSLAFSLTGQFDETRAIIPAVSVSATASGDKTKSTTGTKLVGEKAKGSVQIANGNGNPINLAAGTVLTSSSGLKFVTDSAASVSGQLVPGNPGTATMSVVSNDIGAQYNLAKGEVFKVGLFDKSQVAGTSQGDFSGGSSLQIAAVSADDQKKLEQDLKTELSAKVLNELNSKVDSDQVFINDLSGQTVTSQTFDHKIGDTADTLKLTLNVTGNGVLADKAKLLQYAVDSLKSKIPQGYALRSSQINFKFTFTGKRDENLGYNADIVANFLPLVKTSDVAKQISGKNTTVVVDYLSTIPGYSRADIKLSPNFPIPFKSLPHVYQNIKIEVLPEE